MWLPSPQERRQYEWYNGHTRGHISLGILGEREREIMTGPPERHEKKVGKKKSPQGETTSESRDEIKTRAEAQKLEQQAWRAKAQQSALLHAVAPTNVHHMSTRHKTQSRSDLQP